MEVYIPGTWPVHVISGCLAQLVGIKDYSNMKVLIVQPHNHIAISSLEQLSVLGGKRWANVSREKARMYDMQWYLASGDLLLLQDSTEPLRELSDKEKTSILRAGESDARSLYGSYGTGTSYMWPDDDLSTSTVKSTAARPVGIHIRKHVANDNSIGGNGHINSGEYPAPAEGSGSDAIVDMYSFI